MRSADSTEPGAVQESVPSRRAESRQWWIVGMAGGLVVMLWCLPWLWYNKGPRAGGMMLELRPAVAGWAFQAGRISESEERALFADEVETGVFRAEGKGDLRWFSARRRSGSPKEIGLFVHTPDRCWTESGWKIEESLPERMVVESSGGEWILERRLFRHGDALELVYFGGLVDGSPPGFRLDHNLSVAMRHQLRRRELDGTSSLARVWDGRMWGRAWETFQSRNSLTGSRMLFRISTAVREDAVAQGDRTLREFLRNWIGSGSRFVDGPPGAG